MKPEKVIDKLSRFIDRLISMLESELDFLEGSTLKSDIKNKKNITEMLQKLIELIIRLNKMQEESTENCTKISASDQKIIQDFLNKYSSRSLDNDV